MCAESARSADLGTATTRSSVVTCLVNQPEGGMLVLTSLVPAQQSSTEQTLRSKRNPGRGTTDTRGGVCPGFLRPATRSFWPSGYTFYGSKVDLAQQGRS